MPKRLPPLNALKAFESAARNLSFTRAADELFVTQAAVSHQIKTLESFLSTKLFLRKNRSLLLTEEGQAYFAELKEIFIQMQEATDRVLAMGAKGAITVATPPSYASQWLVPKISQFTQANPSIDVRIKAVDLDEGFLDETVDVAVYYGKGKWPNLSSVKLHAEYLTPMCSPLLLNSNKPLDTLSDLKNHVLLHDGNRAVWKSWLKHFSVPSVNVNQGPMFSHTMLVLQAAALGQGIALSTTVLAKADVDAGRLICPFEEKIESKEAYYLVCHQAQSDNPKIQMFRDWMLSQIDSSEL
jgi:LysR family glycine cleavage system transcriptional activator